MNILNELTIKCIKSAEHNNSFFSKLKIENNYMKSDQHAVSGMGVFASDIAKEHPLTVEKCRHHLNKLWLEGKILKKPTKGGSTRWWPVGLIKHLKDKTGN